MEPVYSFKYSQASNEPSLFHKNQAEHVDSFKELTRQNYEISKKAQERFIDSLKLRSEYQFNVFNSLKGGSKATMQEADSKFQNFQYEVFQQQTLNEQFTGISRLVRERLNDPNYYNNRLSGMADQIRQNLKKQRKLKRARLGDEAVPSSDEEKASQQTNNEEANHQSHIGKPPKYPFQQPVYSFQKQYMPIRTKVEAVEKKGKSFKELMEYYKPLIEEKNADQQELFRENIF